MISSAADTQGAERDGCQFLTADDRLLRSVQPSFGLITSLAGQRSVEPYPPRRRASRWLGASAGST